jgi:hypothetical protein
MLTRRKFLKFLGIGAAVHVIHAIAQPEPTLEELAQECWESEPWYYGTKTDDVSFMIDADPMSLDDVIYNVCPKDTPFMEIFNHSGVRHEWWTDELKK